MTQKNDQYITTTEEFSGKLLVVSLIIVLVLLFAGFMLGKWIG